MEQILLMIYFSVKLSRLAKDKNESKFAWVFRYLSLCIGFELFLMYVLSFFVQQADLLEKMNKQEVVSLKELLPLLVFGLISCLLIYFIYVLLRKSLLSIENPSIDNQDDDIAPPTSPPKDLSYFR
jgi:hypothetical protein